MAPYITPCLKPSHQLMKALVPANIRLKQTWSPTAQMPPRPTRETRLAVSRTWRWLGIACLLLSSAQSPPAFHGCIADHYTCRLGRVSLTNALQNSVRHYHLATTPILRSQVAIAPRPRPCYLLATKTQFQLPPSDSRPGMAKSFMQVLSDDRRSPCIPCSRHL